MNTQDTAKDKPGMYVIPQLRPMPPVIAFGTTSAITDLDPQDKCKCGNWNIDCICDKGEG